MNTTSDGGNQHGRGLRGDPGADRGQSDGTRDQMCNKISELEAARNHLRAQLQQLEKYVRHAPRCSLVQPRQYRVGMHFEEHDWGIATVSERELIDGPGDSCTCGLADLLAVLTEPQQQKKHEKTNENVTRSAETDVNRAVALPQRED